MDNRTSLVNEAEALGIAVDGRWSDARLQTEIDKKKAEETPEPEAAPEAKPEPEAGTTPVRLLYDTWDADEKRVPAGAIVNLPIEAAKTLLREHKAERADPLPGEKAV